jgi:hypothetical protein
MKLIGRTILLLLGIYISVTAFIYRFSHTEKTETQLIMSADKWLTLNFKD